MLSRPKTIENSISCSFIHPGPTNLRRNHSEARLSKTASSAQGLQAPLNPTLSRIKSRLGNIKLDVNPEIAAAVVKRYLLPMFESKSKRFSLKPRACRFNTEENPESRMRTGDTVYNDLKLNEQLMEEIAELKRNLRLAEIQVRDSAQQLLSSQEMSSQLQEKHEKLETNFEFLNFQYNQQTKYTQRIEIRSGLILEQLNKYKSLYQESLAREHDSISKLEAERSENDIRLLYHIPIP